MKTDRASAPGEPSNDPGRAFPPSRFSHAAIAHQEASSK